MGETKARKHFTLPKYDMNETFVSNDRLGPNNYNLCVQFSTQENIISKQARTHKVLVLRV